MNSDPGPYLGSDTNDNSMSRYKLELSDKQVKSELSKAKQHHVNEAELGTGNNLVIGRSIDCKACKRIPNELWECEKCSEIHCTPCKEDEKVKCCGANNFVKLRNKQIIS